MKKSIITKVYFVLLGISMPLLTFAQDSTGFVQCGPEGQFAKECTINDIFILLVTIFNWLLGMGAVVAFIFLIYGGMRMFLYSVDESNLETGKKTVIEALIGLAIIGLSYVIVNTLLGALGIKDPQGYFDGSKLEGGV